MMTRLRRAISVAFLATVLTVGTVMGAITWRNATSNGDAEAVLRNLIVAEHARVCANTLAPDSRLTWLARYRSTDMMLRGYFSHTAPEGLKFWNFMQKAGIRYANAGEIIAWNSYPDDLSPRAAYNAFMGSSGHRAAIRSCTYTNVGVGSYKIGAKHMYTALFMRPA